jgi:tRNA nucleotidyltransferase (CCA-adding enzyme)
MKELDLLKFIHPSLTITPNTEKLFDGLSETLTWFRLLYLDIPLEKGFVYFLGLLDRLKGPEAEEALERLAAPMRIRERVRLARSRCHDVLPILSREPLLAPSRVYALVHPLDIESILLMMAKARQELARKYISLYLTHLRSVTVMVTGDDLKLLGIPPGPRFRTILAELLDAKLDEEVRTLEDEREFVKRRARE